MININDRKKRNFNKRDEIEENHFFEYGAHFKYKDLYNKLLQIENEKKNNNKNSSCNIIMDNLKKNEINKGISRNQFNNNNINISCNNNNENFIYSLKNLNNIIAKNKINESCPHRSNYNKENKINKKNKNQKNEIEKNENKIQKNNVLKNSIFKNDNNNEKILVNKCIINKEIEDNCSKSFSQIKNSNSTIKKNLLNLNNENDIKTKFSNYFKQQFSKIFNKESILKKLSPIRNINNSNKSNSSLINQIPISRNQSENKNKFKNKSHKSNNQKNIIENKSISNNISQQSSASTENKTSYILCKNQKIIHLKKKYDNHNLCYKQNAETVPCKKNNILKKNKGKEFDVLSMFLNKKNKKRNNISAEKNFILKHSIFQCNRISSTQNKKMNNSNFKSERKNFNYF